MRTVGDFITVFVPLLLLGIAISSTIENWAVLDESGGWFAILGHFLAVAATLAMLVVSAGLALSLLVLPVVLFYMLAGPDSRDAPLGATVAALRRGAMTAADGVWKRLWWCWWRVHAGARSADRRP